MDLGWDDSRTDALCRRRCAFVLYRLPGEQGEVHFCMQADGGYGAWQPQERGFVFAPFAQAPLVIHDERSHPAAAGSFAPLAPLPPATPPTTREAYGHLFARYRAQLPTPLRKIVLARTEDAAVPAGFSPTATFRRACELSPRTMNALIHTAEHGTWLCCTPELLLQGRGSDWETMALAGTRPATEGAPAPWDEKNRREQQLVADSIRRQLVPMWESGDESPTCTLRAGAVEHLCTRFRFRMEAARLTELLAALPPTPAVSGYPVQAALDWLRREPDIERGLYAGYLGPVEEERAQLFVTLRCMRLYPALCRLYAGGGIMPDSDEDAEWRETQAKMLSMRRLLPLD